MSAQARAFSESKEYILPAFFNEAVEVPGVLKTTGRISLVSLTPEELAEKITEKLRDHGVLITVDDRFRYPPHAKADIDFPLSDHDQVTEIITALKSSNWYIQSPAIDKIFLLDWSQALSRSNFRSRKKRISVCMRRRT